MDGRKSCIARYRRITALLLQVIEKRQDRVAPDVVQSEFYDRTLVASCCKLQQPADRVPVSMQCVRADSANGDQVLPKEGLDESCQG